MMLSYVCGLRLIWLSCQRWAFAMKPLACALYNSIMAALMLQSTLSWQTGTVLLEVRIKRLGNATRFVFATHAIQFLLAAKVRQNGICATNVSVVEALSLQLFVSNICDAVFLLPFSINPTNMVFRLTSVIEALPERATWNLLSRASGMTEIQARENL